MICIVNVDPFSEQEGACVIPVALGLPPAFDAHDLLGEREFTWRVGRNYVKLGPGKAHLIRSMRCRLDGADPGAEAPACPAPQAGMTDPANWFERDPLWFKKAVFYEIHLRGFYDGNDDGSGDFRGLAEKLDYLQWLGVDCLWLLPAFPNPLRDGGYDIADFFGIHQDYGDVEDFTFFVDQAHQRGMRVIADLVMNDTSSDHPWFQESRTEPSGPYGDWYVWGDDDTRWSEARIIFIDTELSTGTRYPARGQYYWHRFFSHQPGPELRQPGRAGADAERAPLLARPRARRVSARCRAYLYERDGTNGEKLPETHAFCGGCAARSTRATRIVSFGRGQSVAGRCRAVLRRRRRVPHGLPLSRDATHVHGDPARGCAADCGDPGVDAADPTRSGPSCATTTS